MDQRIIDLWDEFTHGGMDRRDFMQRLAGMAGGMTGGGGGAPVTRERLRATE